MLTALTKSLLSVPAWEAEKVRTAPSRGGLIWPYKGLILGYPLKRALSRLMPTLVFLAARKRAGTLN